MYPKAKIKSEFDLKYRTLTLPRLVNIYIQFWVSLGYPNIEPKSNK